jgi:hypothetical protein
MHHDGIVRGATQPDWSATASGLLQLPNGLQGQAEVSIELTGEEPGICFAASAGHRSDTSTCCS